MQPPLKAFTKSAAQIRNVLQTEVHITEAFNPSSITVPINPQNLGAKEYIAIWDTGATGSIITQKVVNELGLKPIGVTELHTANDRRAAPLFNIAIFLPNMICMPELQVAEATVTSDADILIGMDIINEGDFAVTNKDGKTVFTFRMPSTESIDFVKEFKDKQTVRSQIGKIGRNDPCHCGSGKKFKKCHGR